MTFSNPSKLPIVVIGAGASGIYFSNKLGKFKEILLLESGPLKSFIENDKRNNYKTTQKRPYRCGHIGRVRGFGGATNIWGGQMLPFDENTFSSEKGWPILFSELKPFYESVSKILLDEPLSFEIKKFVNNKIYSKLSLHRSFYIHISKWISNPIFKLTIGKHLPSKVKLLEEITVIGIEPNSDGNYNIHCKDGNLKKLVIKASNVVISTGTIETVRLLKFSKKYYGLPVKEEIGNGFMDHLSFLEGICSLKPQNRWALLKFFNTKITRKGKRFSVRITTKVGRTANDEDLAASFSIAVLSPIQKWKRLINYVISIASILFFGFVYKPFGKIILTGIFEQSPKNKNRYIDLMKDNIPFINCPPSNKEIDVFLSHSKSLVEALFLKGWLKERVKIPSRKALLDKITDVCHPMGGTPMNIDTKKSIVTRDLELINCPKIWVNSASVFPSGNHSNPTMTLLAFSDRLANHILNL